jgi:DNA-binding NarL/FixJ family response regulator
VLVLNPLLPKRKAHTLLKELRQQAPTTRILLLATEWCDCLHNTAPLQGASGYILRSAPREELRMAIRIIYHGGEVKPFALVRSKLNDFSELTIPGWLAPFLNKFTQGRFWAPLRERLASRSVIMR